MITHIYISNFAIIKELEAELGPGLSVVTGETGAGKSIVIEALSMALGGRADKTMVRSGENRAVITLVTDAGELPEVMTREIGASGKSVAKVDGEAVPLSQLEAMTFGHVDVHGQYDHQSLLSPEKHISLLDAYGRSSIAPALERVLAAFTAYEDVRGRLSELKRGAAMAERELDFLKYEIKEIEGAGLKEGEDEELEARVRIMQSSEKIYEALAGAYGSLSGEQTEVTSALSAVSAVRDSLSGLSDYSGDFAKMADMSADAYYMLEELESQVRVARDAMDFSQNELDEALARLDRIDRLKAKYGGSVSEVLEHMERAAARVDAAENSDAQIAALEKELAAACERYAGEAGELSELRRTAAKCLEGAIMRQLADLSFKDATFSVSIESDENRISGTGTDNVEFMLSANKGQPLLPLAKVASGGELSRIMLAFKSVTGDFDGVGTMIFDEIDSGISGLTASIVGEKLLNMAGSHQIVCITHLPQIAACADRHYLLEKHTEGEETFTTLREIKGDEQVDEIARLVGGRTLTETTRENARELIKQARS